MGSIDWFIWRPIIAKKATLKELESHYSMTDLLMLHEAMDIESDIEQMSMKKNKN